MNAADIELARMVYLASSLAIVLFTSMILRGLWRPLRFVLLALAISLLFTPFFIEQAMPDGTNQNIVPAFVVMAHNGVSDREHWQEAIQHAGKPIVVVAGITSILALLLALALPKPKKKISQKNTSQKKTSQQQSEQPVSEKNTSLEKIATEKKILPKKQKKYKKKKKNPYLPDDFQPE